jgi:hypothetical protein
MRHFFLFLGLLMGTLFPLTAQESQSDAKVPFLSLYLSVLHGAGSPGDLPWRPDWPPSIPPEAFKTATPAVSVELPQDKGTLVYALNPKGQVQRLLVPDGETGKFLSVAVTWSNQGPMETLTIFQDSKTQVWRIRSFSDVPAPIPLPGRIELWGDKDQTTVVCTYRPGEVTETWYDSSAVAVALYQYTVDDRFRLRDQRERDEQGQIISETSYDYNSQNLISRIISPSGTMTALYDSLGRPVELHRWMKKKAQNITATAQGPEGKSASQVGGPASPQADGKVAPQVKNPAAPQADSKTIPQADGKAAPQAEENPKEDLYRYQWGDDGLLRRMTGTLDDGTTLDYRYDYSLDTRGSWVKRRTTSMELRFGVLVPQWGPTVERKITYFKEDQR